MSNSTQKNGLDFLNEIHVDHTEVAPVIDPKEFVKVVESRRSVRKFTSEPIPEAVTRECLRLAHLAPSSSNLHHWEFHWIRSPELREKMHIACMGQNGAKTAAELIVCVARTNTWRRNADWLLSAMEKLGPLPKGVPEYYRKIIPALYRTGFLGWRVPIKWAILTWRGFFTATPRGPLGHKAVEEVAVKSAALACENLMLAFRAFGFDTLPMEGFDECRVRKALALPRDAKVVMVIGAGKRSPHGIYGPRIRLPLKNFLFER